MKKPSIRYTSLLLCSAFLCSVVMPQVALAEEQSAQSVIASEDEWNEKQEEYSSQAAVLESQESTLTDMQAETIRLLNEKETADQKVKEIESNYNTYVNREFTLNQAKGNAAKSLAQLEDAKALHNSTVEEFAAQTKVYEDTLAAENGIKDLIEAQPAIIAQKEEECAEPLAKFRRGARGFFEYVNNDRALQIMDSDIAKQWNNEGDLDDATALDLMKRSIEFQIEIEDIRANVYGLERRGITDELMAAAQVRANRIKETITDEEYVKEPTLLHVKYFGVGDLPVNSWQLKEEFSEQDQELFTEEKYPWFDERLFYDMACRRLGIEVSDEERVKVANYDLMFDAFEDTDEYEYYKNLQSMIGRDVYRYQTEIGITTDYGRATSYTTGHYFNQLSINVENTGMAVTGYVFGKSRSLCQTNESMSLKSTLPKDVEKYYNRLDEMGNLGTPYSNTDYLARFMEYYEPLKTAIKPYEDEVNRLKEYEEQLVKAEKNTQKEKKEYDRLKNVLSLDDVLVESFQSTYDEDAAFLTTAQSSYDSFVAEHGVITSDDVSSAIAAQEEASAAYEEAKNAELEFTAEVKQIRADVDALKDLTAPHSDADPQYIENFHQTYEWNSDCTTAEMTWEREDGKVAQKRYAYSIESTSDEYSITYTAHFLVMGKEFTTTKTVQIKDVPKNIVGTAVTAEPNDSPLIAYLYPTSMDMEEIVDDIWDNNAANALNYTCETTRVGKFEGGRTLWRYSIKDVEPGTYSVALYKSGHVVSVIFAVKMQDGIVDVDASEYQMLGETENAYIQYSQIFGSGTQYMRQYGDYDNDGSVNMKDVIKLRHDFSTGKWEETVQFLRADVSCSFTNRESTRIADIRALVSHVNGMESIMDQYYR